MPVLDPTEWEPCLLEPVHDRKLERAARQAYGVLPPSVPYLAHSPWLVQGVNRNNFRKRLLLHLDVHLAELIFLAVSQDSSCRHCYEGQRLSLRLQGFSDAEIQRLEVASFETAGDRRIGPVLDFARRLSRANPAPGPKDLEPLRELGHGEDAVREMVYMAAYTVIGNRMSTLPAIPPDGLPDPDGLFIRLIGPLIARRNRSSQHPGPGEPLPEALRDGPFAYVALALDGLPVARNVAEFFQSPWAGARLPKRAQALVYAVVARGLGSERAEAEAKRLLAGEGLEEAQVDQLLTHLASPKLDPLEAALVPFARETIRYRPPEIQRRARELRDAIGVEAFVDTVGVTSIANGICRLSLALCED